MKNGRVQNVEKVFAEFREKHKQRGKVKRVQIVIEIPKEVLFDTKQTIEQVIDFAKKGILGQWH